MRGLFLTSWYQSSHLSHRAYFPKCLMMMQLIIVIKIIIIHLLQGKKKNLQTGGDIMHQLIKLRNECSDNPLMLDQDERAGPRSAVCCNQLKMRIAHLSVFCTSHWILLMLNATWLGLIIISPEDEAMNESDDGGGEVQRIHDGGKIKSTLLYFRLLVSGEKIQISTLNMALKHS